MVVATKSMVAKWHFILKCTKKELVFNENSLLVFIKICVFGMYYWFRVAPTLVSSRSAVIYEVFRCHFAPRK